jgi:glycerol-1-phosphatase
VRDVTSTLGNWSDNCNKTDVKEMEGRLPLEHGDDAVEIPGARRLLDELISFDAPWTIVTSGTMPLVGGWLKVLNFAIPDYLVTAESVENGKPDPSCYIMGREKLGLQDSDKEILVLEDSPAGIKSGKAAGCKVVGLVTSHTLEQVVSAGPDWVVKDLDSLKAVKMEEGRVVIEFSDLLG